MEERSMMVDRHCPWNCNLSCTPKACETHYKTYTVHIAVSESFLGSTQRSSTKEKGSVPVIYILTPNHAFVNLIENFSGGGSTMI